MMRADLTDDDVHLIIDHMIADDRQHGQAAEFVWASLTAGEGPAMVTLAGIQLWLWWLLPKRSIGDPVEWAEAATAGTDLFTRLGEARYADVFRSDTTRKVFSAWAKSRSDGVRACRAAQGTSGVEPPDLADFEWGDTFGSWELRAREAVELALEEAIDDGRLKPGAKGWREVASGICSQVLDHTEPGSVGQTWRTLVVSERADTWAGRHATPVQREARRTIARQYLARPEAPTDEVAAALMAPLVWLAGHCREGVTLTASHYLPPVLMHEALDLFGWADKFSKPRSEADVPQLVDLRAVANRLKVVHRKHRRLAVGNAGLALLADPQRLWNPWVDELGGDNPYDVAASELTALALLGHPTGDMPDDELRTLVGQALVEQGWRHADEPARFEDHDYAAFHAVRRWQLWGVARFVRARWEATPTGPKVVEPASMQLTEMGRVALSHWLHRRITGPQSLR